MASATLKTSADVEPARPLEHTGPDSELPERTAPERIGRYQLCFELAAGGMATVYLARADGVPGFEKLVALKRIHRHLAKERDYVEMFLDEARIASRITHANVCTVFDFGEAQGEYFIAMEYLVGEPLSRLYRRVEASADQRASPLLPLRMARIIADACEGLHAAHELRDGHGDLLNVVHRDVSARNLFVTYGGIVQVVDFGIASARQRVHQTSTGQVKGTFPYMAPEQMTSGNVDRRVDIWALGVVLWELLTQKRLFRRDTDVNTMYAVLSDAIPLPSSVRSNVPRELDEIVLRALQRNPDERWQTAREMGQALGQFLSRQGQSVGAAELSEWMAEVFSNGEARKRQLMEIARLADVTLPIPRRSEEVDASGSDTVLLLADATRRSKAARTLSWALVVSAVVAAGALAIAWRGPNEKGVSGKRSDTDVGAVATALAAAPETSPEAPTPAVEPLDDDSLFEQQLALDTPAPEPAPRAPAAKDEDPSPPAEPAGPPGTINLVTVGGWAKVYSGRKYLGTTPKAMQLPSGRHKLTLQPFGEGPSQVIMVDVEPRRTKRVSIKLGNVP